MQCVRASKCAADFDPSVLNEANRELVLRAYCACAQTYIGCASSAEKASLCGAGGDFLAYGCYDACGVTPPTSTTTSSGGSSMSQSSVSATAAQSLSSSPTLSIIFSSSETSDASSIARHIALVVISGMFVMV